MPRGDSALLVVRMHDNGAINAFRSKTATGRPVPRNEVLTNLDQILLTTISTLDEMSRAPRRPVPPTP